MIAFSIVAIGPGKRFIHRTRPPARLGTDPRAVSSRCVAQLPRSASSGAISPIWRAFSRSACLRSPGIGDRRHRRMAGTVKHVATEGLRAARGACPEGDHRSGSGPGPEARERLPGRKPAVPADEALLGDTTLSIVLNEAFPEKQGSQLHLRGGLDYDQVSSMSSALHDQARWGREPGKTTQLVPRQ